MPRPTTLPKSLRRPLPRRQLLRGSVAVATATGVVAAAGGTSAVGSQSLPVWSDPATWGTAGVPRPGDAVVVDFPVCLDQDIQVASLHIECGGHVVVDPDTSVTIQSTGNVEVCGTLEMRPAGHGVQHTLRFEGVDESRFIGGGMHVLESDVGLWVHDAGRLDLVGSQKVPWVRASGSLEPGARTIRLLAEPEGWQVGDEVAVTPTGSPVDKQHSVRFDEARIEAVTGSVITLSTPLRFGHPQVAIGDGHVLTAEVLNLTRNVRVEGTPNGRIHTFVHSRGPVSRIGYVGFRHFGPRQSAGSYTQSVLGRYGLHFHMAEDLTRGTVVEGVVARDGGGHAFVTHLSHGVRHVGNISYRTTDTAYWWDHRPDRESPAPKTHDVSYESCVAALVTVEPEFRGFRLAGFELGAGTGNRAVGCIATGVQGNKESSGFHWPEGSPGVWTFTDCVSHDNKVGGLFTWQNGNTGDHEISRFVAVHNGGFGISHGAYINAYHFRDSILFGNLRGGFELHATSHGSARGLVLANLLVDGAGLSPYAVEVIGHRLPGDKPTLVQSCRFTGYREAGIAVTGRRPQERGTQPDLIDIVGCTFAPRKRKLLLGEDIHAASVLRLGLPQRALSVRPRSSRGGTYRPRWNARVSVIQDFAAYVRPGPVTLTILRGAGTS
jgi:hypothetical protein